MRRSSSNALRSTAFANYSTQRKPQNSRHATDLRGKLEYIIALVISLVGEKTAWSPDASSHGVPNYPSFERKHPKLAELSTTFLIAEHRLKDDCNSIAQTLFSRSLEGLYNVYLRRHYNTTAPGTIPLEQQQLNDNAGIALFIGPGSMRYTHVSPHSNPNIPYLFSVDTGSHDVVCMTLVFTLTSDLFP